MLELTKHPVCRQLAVGAPSWGPGSHAVSLVFLSPGGVPRSQPTTDLGSVWGHLVPQDQGG